MSNTAAIAVEEEMASSQLKFEPAKSAKQKPLKKNKKDNIEGKFCKLNNPGQLPLLNELSQRISQSQTRGEQEPIYSSKDPLMLKINQCLAMMGNPDMDQVLGSRSFGLNDVYLWKLEGNICCCHGCHGQIDKVVQQYPVDIVFQLKMKINIRVGNSNNWLPVNAQVYFHPKMKCLQQFNRGIECQNLRVSDDVLMSLTTDHFDWLHVQGFLLFVVKNKLSTLWKVKISHLYLLYCGGGCWCLSLCWARDAADPNTFPQTSHRAVSCGRFCSAVSVLQPFWTSFYSLCTLLFSVLCSHIWNTKDDLFISVFLYISSLICSFQFKYIYDIIFTIFAYLLTCPKPAWRWISCHICHNLVALHLHFHAHTQGACSWPPCHMSWIYTHLCSIWGTFVHHAFLSHVLTLHEYCQISFSTLHMCMKNLFFMWTTSMWSFSSLVCLKVDLQFQYVHFRTSHAWGWGGAAATAPWSWSLPSSSLSLSSLRGWPSTAVGGPHIPFCAGRSTLHWLSCGAPLRTQCVSCLSGVL